MSIDIGDMDDGTQWGVSQLLARAAVASQCVDYGLTAAIDDFFLPAAARLDEKVRATLSATLAGVVSAIENPLRQHAGRLLASDAAGLAAALMERAPSVYDQLMSAGVLRDADLMRELVARARQDVLSDALPFVAPESADRASLLTRHALNPDGVIAAAAMALLAAENRRYGDRAVGTTLPADLHRRLTWWIAAALRQRFAETGGGGLAALDSALVAAGQRGLAAHDEREGLEAAAMRLAVALDPRADERAALLVEALADRRLSLFVALIGHALGLAYGEAREIVLDPAGDRLWLVLRALDLDRDAIAGIGVALGAADPRRNLEAFAEALDGIAATSPASARAALGPMLLPPEYRAAMVALARGGRP